MARSPTDVDRAAAAMIHSNQHIGEWPQDGNVGTREERTHTDLE